MLHSGQPWYLSHRATYAHIALLSVFIIPGQPGNRLSSTPVLFMTASRALGYAKGGEKANVPQPTGRHLKGSNAGGKSQTGIPSRGTLTSDVFWYPPGIQRICLRETPSKE